MPRPIPSHKVELVKRLLANTKKSHKQIAKESGVSKQSVHRINKLHGIRPIFYKKKEFLKEKEGLLKERWLWQNLLQ